MSVSASLNRIEPQSGTAFRMRAGETLIVTDPCGEQVADLFAYNADDVRETLSSGRSIDYAETIYLSTGNVLYSNRSRPMFAIAHDTVGRHDFLLTPCSIETFEIMYRHSGPHPSCFDNLVRAFEPFGLGPETIGTTFNIFMNAPVSAEGRVAVLPPRSVAGDRIELRAEMNLIVGLTACSAEMSNNFEFKPIDWVVRPEEGAAAGFAAALHEHLAALQAKDVRRFAATLGDDVLVVDGRGERKRGTAAVLQAHAEWFALGGWTFDYEVLFKRECGSAALALVEVFYRHTAQDAPAHFLLSLLFERDAAGKWNFIYDQNTPLPAISTAP